MSKKRFLIGAHTSTSGGIEKALLEGEQIGATTIQMFTSNQRQWKGRPFTDEMLEKWKKALEQTDIKEIMSHASYLINLGSPNPENLEKSRNTFQEEIHRCLQLGVSYLNFHPGAALESTREACLEKIVSSLKEMEPLLTNGKLRLLLEATAGQGSSVGDRFEDLGYIVSRLEKTIPIGVCIDTCHIFAAGYDIRTEETWNKTLEEFDRIVGLKHLYAFHLNDSMKPYASHRDRHADLGKGEIGLECFKFLMTDPRVKELPKYLETPNGPEQWTKEIRLLREMGNEDA